MHFLIVSSSGNFFSVFNHCLVALFTMCVIVYNFLYLCYVLCLKKSNELEMTTEFALQGVSHSRRNSMTKEENKQEVKEN